MNELFPGGPAPAEDQPQPPGDDHVRLAEALIFASADPVSARSLAALLPEDVDAADVLRELQRRYAGRGVELAEIGIGWQFRTAPDLAGRLTRTISRPRRLPRVAMETLAIVAWHQPVTRAQIEEIRGAALSQATLDALLELALIRPAGHRDVPGRPTLWATTPAFLAQFGLRDLSDLPKRSELVLEANPSPVSPAEDRQVLVSEPETSDAQLSLDTGPGEAPPL